MKKWLIFITILCILGIIECVGYEKMKVMDPSFLPVLSSKNDFVLIGIHLVLMVLLAIFYFLFFSICAGIGGAGVLELWLESLRDIRRDVYKQWEKGILVIVLLLTIPYVSFHILHILFTS